MVVLGDGCPWNDGEGLPAEAPNTREMAGPEVWLGRKYVWAGSMAGQCQSAGTFNSSCSFLGQVAERGL